MRNARFWKRFWFFLLWLCKKLLWKSPIKIKSVIIFMCWLTVKISSLWSPYFLCFWLRWSLLHVIKQKLCLSCHINYTVWLYFLMKSTSLMCSNSIFTDNITQRGNLWHRGGRLEEVVGQPFEVNLDFIVLLYFIRRQGILPDG